MVRIPISRLALPEEHRAEIGSVDLCMAHGASLILGVLVMGRSQRSSRRSIHVRCMATKTEEIDVVDLQEPRIVGTVRRMTGHAALVGLHRCVFENEGPHGVGVTLGADGKLACGGAN